MITCFIKLKYVPFNLLTFSLLVQREALPADAPAGDRHIDSSRNSSRDFGIDRFQVHRSSTFSAVGWAVQYRHWVYWDCRFLMATSRGRDYQAKGQGC